MTFNTSFFIKTLGVCFRAAPVSLQLFFFSFLASFVLGLLFALVRIHGGRIGKGLITAYLSLIRGIPVVVQILVVYSIFPSVFQGILDGIGSNFRIYDLNPIVYAYIVFILNTTAALTEILRSAILTVNPGQLEAAETAGLTRTQAYIRILLPQALVSATPNLCTAATNLIKSTSLAFLMTVKDITAVAKIEAAYGYNYIEAYMDVWIVYLVLNFVLELLFKALEQRQKRYFTAV